MKRSVLISAGLAAVALASAANADSMFGFNATSANNVNQVAAGTSQLRMVVGQTVAGTVDFKFIDHGAIGMTIANVYFSQDATLLSGITTIINGPGVTFASGGSPGNLPSAPAGFVADFRARAANPAPQNGVNPGEFLILRMALAGTHTVTDVLNAVTSGYDLRIGIHLISIDCPGGGGSESFVNAITPLIPLPSAAGLGFAGLGVLGARRRRR